MNLHHNTMFLVSLLRPTESPCKFLQLQKQVVAEKLPRVYRQVVADKLPRVYRQVVAALKTAWKTAEISLKTGFENGFDSELRTLNPTGSRGGRILID